MKRLIICLSTLILPLVGAMANVVSYNVPEEGTLKSIISSEAAKSITELKLTGSINGDDIQALHDLGLDTSLTYLDLSNVSIVSGGSYEVDIWATHTKIPTISNEISFGMLGGLTSLETLKLPKGITQVDQFIFSEDKKLKHLYIYDATPPTFVNKYNVQTNHWGYNITSGKTLHVPAGTASSYSATDWKSFGTIVEEPALIPVAILSSDIVTYNVSEAGTLKNIIPSDAVKTITELKLTGSINGDDIQVLHDLGLDTLLTYLDLSNVSIISGGSYEVDIWTTHTKIPTISNEISFGMLGGLTSLETLKLPKGVTQSDQFIFSEDKSLKDVYIYDTTPPTFVNKYSTDGNHWGYHLSSVKTLHVPAGTASAYATTDWKNFGTIEEFTTDNSNALKTLTFTYAEEEKATAANGVDGIYKLNTGSQTPGWYNARAKVTKIVFDTSFANARPTSTYEWFYGMAQLSTINNIENLNTESVTNMISMFDKCSSLTDIDLSHFNTQNVTSVSGMFCDCSNLESLGLSNFNTSNVVDMKYMFSSCSSLKSLDINNFNTQSVTNIAHMFYGCSSLASLNLGKNDFKNATNTSSVFYGVGTSTKPCVLTISENFDKNVLGTLIGGNPSYYKWLSGYFTLNEVSTGIDKSASDGIIVEPNAPAYNLAGQRVGNDYKGVVIVGGKKFVRK